MKSNRNDKGNLMLNLVLQRLRFALAVTAGLALLCADLPAQVRSTTRPGTTGQTPGGFGGFGGTLGGGARGGTSGTRSYLNNTMVGEAMITSDPETRKLIIITDDETNVNIQEVIKSLDKPKPQVLIKVVFLQVTHGNDLDLGVEGSYTHKAHANSTNTAQTLFGLGSAATAATGGFYKILNDDLEVTIRALQTYGKTEILSRPSILARNNQQATIVIGQEVPIITNTRVTDQNALINTVQYQDVGIILRVTPFITSDGLVEMIVAPEISSLTGGGVDIGGGTEAPIIAKRSADTVVVTPNGRTVAIGGLIEKNKMTTDKKVPILGDIPLLGYFFRRKEISDTKTELLIFMTPTVVQHPADLAKLAAEERDRLQVAPEVFKEKELDRFIEGLPAREPPPGKSPVPRK